jgi:hypothetical protein
VKRVKTNDLIGLMVEDTPVGLRLGRVMAYAMLIGIAVSAAILLSTIGIRANMAEAIGTARVLFKIGFTLVLAVIACRLVFRIGQPGVELKWRGLALLVPLLLLICAIAVELAVVPKDAWETAMMGRYSGFCLFFIPLLSLAPLGGFLWALRYGAPGNPGVAGAVAGLAAGGLAAAIYAWHCPDDSPLFVASWYMLAISLVTLSGFLLGRRLLKW